MRDGRLVWAFVTSPSDDPNAAGARLMLAQADGPFDAESQAVLFYCWAPDVRELHDELAAAGVEVGDVQRRFYMPAGEFRVIDPDGYIVLVGQLGDAGRDEGEVVVRADPARRDQLAGDLDDAAHAGASTP